MYQVLAAIIEDLDVQCGVKLISVEYYGLLQGSVKIVTYYVPVYFKRNVTGQRVAQIATFELQTLYAYLFPLSNTIPLELKK